MSTNWDLYNKRLNINGSTERDRTINKFQTTKNKRGLASPSCKTISIEKPDKSTFVDMKVFINSKTEKNKKSISPVINTDTLTLGGKVKWKNCDWLVTELNLDDDVFVDGTIQQCNYTLPFQLGTSTIIQEPCIVLSQSDTLSGENEGNIITIPDSQRVIYLQYNENTSKLKEGKRLYIDQLTDEPKVYKTTKIDRICYMDGSNGLWKLTCEADSEINESDRPDLLVANYISDNPSPTPIPVPTTTGVSCIANAKGEIYTTAKQIKVGSKIPFDSIFKDTLGNVISGIIPKWSLVLTSEQTNKVNITYNESYPNRVYVQVDTNNMLIGTKFKLHLIDENDLYGYCDLICEVISLT